MSHIISSAVFGKRAAPRTPARRRHASAAAALSPSSLPPPTPPAPPAPSAPRSVATSAVVLQAEVSSQALIATAQLPSPIRTQVEPRPQSPDCRSTRNEDEEHTQTNYDPRGAEDAPQSTTALEVARSKPEATSTRMATRASSKRKCDAQAPALPPKPVKRAKRNSARGNAVVQAALSQDNIDALALPAAPPPAPMTLQPASPLSQVKENSADDHRRRRSKIKSRYPSARQAEIGTNTSAPESGLVEPRRRAAPKARWRERTTATTTTTIASSRERRSENEKQLGDAQSRVVDQALSDPELHEIDPNAVSMFELSHDYRRGRVSEREKKMAEIDWVEVARKRQEDVARIHACVDQLQPNHVQPSQQQGESASSEVIESTEGPSRTTELRHSDQESDRAPTSGLRLTLRNGQIVEDESSLTIDRQARAMAAATALEEPVVEEINLTQRLNRTTWLNQRRRDPMERIPLSRSKSDAWSEEDTERLYDALKMFGTDYFIISKMFPPKTRKQIKLKVQREERIDPMRVNNALLGKHTRPMDLEHYARESNRDIAVFTKYDGVEHADAVILEGLKEKEEAMREAVKEAQENERQQAVQQKQREKQRAVAEKKREERAAAKVAKKGRGRYRIGAGTLGAGQHEEERATEAG